MPFDPLRSWEGVGPMELMLLAVALAAAQLLVHRWRLATAPDHADASRLTLVVGLSATALFTVTSALTLYSDRFLEADSWIEARLAPTDSGRSATNPALHRFVQDIADHDKPYYATFAVLLLVIECVRRRWTKAGFAFVTLAGGLMIMELAKLLLDRPRPAEFDSIGLGAIWETPSGHTFITTVIAGLVYLLWFAARQPRVRRIAAATFTVLVLWVGVIRLLVGTHYPSDIVAGLGLDIAWSGICITLLHIVESHLRPPHAVAHTSSKRENE